MASVLEPGEIIHGITRERIMLPGDIGGWLEGRSQFARLGLMIHVTSGFVQPGVASRQVLEMSNVSGRTLLIHAGVRLLRIVLQRCEGSAVYQGRFARQDNLYAGAKALQYLIKRRGHHVMNMMIVPRGFDPSYYFFTEITANANHMALIVDRRVHARRLGVQKVEIDERANDDRRANPPISWTRDGFIVVGSGEAL